MKKNKILMYLIFSLIVIVTLVSEAMYLSKRYEKEFSDHQLQNNPEIKRIIEVTTNDVRQKAAGMPLSVFFERPSESLSRRLADFFASIHTASVFRVKIWNNSYIVIWSNTPALIGKAFPGHTEVTETLENRVSVEVKVHTKGGSDKQEEFTESSFDNFLELYVPFADSNGKVVGIVEAYESIDGVIAAMDKQFAVSSFAIICGTIVIFGLAGYITTKRLTQV